MNSVLKFGLRSCLTKFNNPVKFLIKAAINDTTLTPAYSRNFWHMCSTSKVNDFLKAKALNECCECGCSGLIHTAGEKDLVSFLQEEIAEEKKTQKMKSLPAELDGFVISSDQAELTFKKKTNFETITISMNVNHSVDSTDVEEGGNFNEEMKAKPAFEVEITRKNKTLSFSCAFTDFDETRDADAGDSFEISEISYFEDEWQENTYSVAADLLDENLYDLFMIFLNEKGITKKFVDRVSEIATSHEHTQYIGLLEKVKAFASSN